MDGEIRGEGYIEHEYLRLTRELERVKKDRDDLFAGCSRLIREVRHLRCLMVEAAQSIDASSEPLLFMQLTGDPHFFVHDKKNPYPEHDDHVSDQYAAFLSSESKSTVRK